MTGARVLVAAWLVAWGVMIGGCSGSDVTLAEGSDDGRWRAVYSGHGTTTVRADGTVVLVPQAAEGDRTHAALVTSVREYGDLDLTVRVRTTAQLRSPSPNPWEVGWVLWHYTDPTHFYYVALKPNGWEIGKEDPAHPGAQRFLATGDRAFATGVAHVVQVRHRNARFEVWADGVHLAAVTDTATPYLRGAIGLYCEDAAAEFLVTSDQEASAERG